MRQVEALPVIQSLGLLLIQLGVASSDCALPHFRKLALERSRVLAPLYSRAHDALVHCISEGWNAIAAEVHNQSCSKSDIGFNFELTGQLVFSAPPRLAISREGGGVTLTWPSDASYFALQSASNLMQPVLWRPATNAAVLSNTVWTVRTSTGANGSQFIRPQAD